MTSTPPITIATVLCAGCLYLSRVRLPVFIAEPSVGVVCSTHNHNAHRPVPRVHPDLHSGEKDYHNSVVLLHALFEAMFKSNSQPAFPLKTISRVSHHLLPEKQNPFFIAGTLTSAPYIPGTWYLFRCSNFTSTPLSVILEYFRSGYRLYTSAPK